ncbi:MAG: hypothetical protein HQK51_18205 [Oligoflexia bacterium]|nr:hypothetical protein [Oligoflexia bacterium]
MNMYLKNILQFCFYFLLLFSQYAFASITDEEFKEIVKKIENIYTPNFKKQGYSFNTKVVENKDFLATETKGRGNKAFVIIHKGIKDHPLMDADAVALVYCHEVGHLMGGSPFEMELEENQTRKFQGEQAKEYPRSFEGQADYFASLKCMRRYLANENNIKVVKQMKVDKTVSELCNKSFSDEGKAAICIRTAMASMTLLSTFAVLHENESPQFSKTDNLISSKTRKGHPPLQCRLDTFMAGALCPVDVEIEVSYENIHQGSCSLLGGHNTRAIRPRCWFYSETEEKIFSGHAGAGVSAGSSSLISKEAPDCR